MNPSLISENSMAESMKNSIPPTTMLQSINSSTTSNQEIFNCSNSMPINKTIFPPEFPSSKVPSPKIPIQFRLTAAKLNYIKSQKSVALEIQRIDPLPTATTSGIDSTTVNHTNRSLVYSEPVSTKGTVPTKNTIETKNTSEFTTNPAINPKNSIYSSRIGNAQNSSATTSKSSVPTQINSLLLPIITYRNSNEPVNGASIFVSHANRAHLEQTFDVSISNGEASIHRDTQNNYSEQVNERYRWIFIFLTTFSVISDHKIKLQLLQCSTCV